MLGLSKSGCVLDCYIATVLDFWTSLNSSFSDALQCIIHTTSRGKSSCWCWLLGFDSMTGCLSREPCGILEVAKLFDSALPHSCRLEIGELVFVLVVETSFQ